MAIVSVPLVLAAVLIAILQTPWAADRVKRMAEREVERLLPDSRFEIGRLSGSLIWGATATDVRLFARDSLVLHVDSVEASYDVLAFLSGSVNLGAVRIVRPTIRARMLPDSTWDIVGLLPEADPDAEPSDPPDVSIDRLVLNDGVLSATGLNPARRILLVDSTQIGLHEMHFARSLRFDSLLVDSRFLVPMMTAPAHLSVQASAADSRFSCHMCSLQSDSSNVLVDGTVDLGGELAAARSDLRVSLAPLSMSDLDWLSPGLHGKQKITGEASIVGAADSLATSVALSSDRGDITLDGVLVRRDTVLLKVDAEVARLDPSGFWIETPLSGKVNSELSVRLAGPDRESLTGTADLRVFDSSLNGRRLKNSAVRIDWTDGIASFDGRIQLPAIELVATGRAIPLADTVHWNVTGQTVSTGFAATYPEIEDLEAFSLRFAATGSSASPQDYFRNLDLHVDRLVYSGFEFDSTNIFADRVDGTVRISANGRASSAETGSRIGAFTVAAGARFEESTEISFNQVLIEGLDVGLGDSTSQGLSDLLIDARGSLTLPDFGQQQGSFSARIEATASGRLLEMQIDSLDLSGTADESTFDLDAALFSGQSRLGLRGRLGYGGPSQSLNVRGSLQRFDVALVSADSLTRSSLNGDFFVDGSWRSVVEHNVESWLNLRSSQWNDQEISRAEIELESRNGAADLSIDISTPSGGIDIVGVADLTAPSFQLTSAEGSFSEIRIDRILGLDQMVTRLNGQIQFSDKQGVRRGFVQLNPSSVNGVEIDGGRVRLMMIEDSLSSDGELVLHDGSIDFSIEGRRQDGLAAIDTRLRTNNADVTRLTGLAPVSSDLNFECSLTGAISIADPLAASDALGVCESNSSRIGETVVTSAILRVQLEPGRLQIDTVEVRSNVADITGRGGVPVERAERIGSDLAVETERADLRVEARLKDLSPLEDILGIGLIEGEGTLDLEVSGHSGSTRYAIEPHLAYLTYDAIRVSTIDGYVQFSDLDLLEAEAVIDVGFTVVGGFPIQKMSVALLADTSAIILASDVTQRAGRRVSLSATYDRTRTTPELRIEDLTMNLAGAVWRLSQEARVEFGEVWDVQQFLVFSDDGQIAVDGHVDPDGEQNLVLTAENVETSSFIDLFGIDSVAGALEGYILLEGPADSLVADASFRVRTLKVFDQLVGDLGFQAAFADRRLDVDGTLRHVTGHEGSIQGSVPVNLTLGGDRDVDESDPLDLSVASDSLPLSWILPFLSGLPVDDVAGILTADVKIGGSWDDPVFEGSGSLYRGRTSLPDYNTSLTDVRGSFSLSGSVLRLEEFEAATGEGRLSASGDIDFESLSDLGLDLEARFEKFRAIATNTYRFTVTGSARVSGSMRSPVVKADVALGPGDVYLTEELMEDETESIALTSRDLRILERRFGYTVAAEDTATSDFVESLDLEAVVSIGRDVWLRSKSNPTMDIEFSGELRVLKPPLQDYRIVGSIDVNPARSRIVQFARRFGVDRGTITFNGPVEEAVVDFRAEYVVPSRFGGDEVRILLAVTGVMEELELDISSEPQMDDATIASYLLTGRPPDQATVSGEQAAEIAIGGVSRLVEAFANENFGLDVVEIEASGTQGARLTVGKYISPETYVFVKQPISVEGSSTQSTGSRTTEVGIEYELVNWLIAEFASRKGNFRVNLRWEISY